MNTLDFILLACLLPAVWQGLRKGLISQVVAIVSLVLSIWISFRFSGPVTAWLASFLTESSPTVLRIASFCLIFLIVGITVRILGHFLEGLFKLAMLGWANRLLGLVFALAKAVLVLSLLVLVFNAIDESLEIVKDRTLMENSACYNQLVRISDTIFPFIKELFSKNA